MKKVPRSRHSVVRTLGALGGVKHNSFTPPLAMGLVLVTTTILAKHLRLELCDIEEKANQNRDDDLGKTNDVIAAVEPVRTIGSEVKQPDHEHNYNARHFLTPFGLAGPHEANRCKSDNDDDNQPRYGVAGVVGTSQGMLVSPPNR